MSSIPVIHQFPCQIICRSSQKSKLIPSNAFDSSNRIGFSAIPIRKSPKAKRSLTVQAAEEGDSDIAVVSGVVIENVNPSEEHKEIENLKKQLVNAFYGTNRGLVASSETRAEIVEMISRLEVKNPTPVPTEALALLNGKWILAYTSFTGLFPLLSREGTFQLVKLEEISQTIDSENYTVQNSVLFAGPLATTEISTNAKFEVRSPKRVQIKFEEGIIGTPQLTDSIELPDNVEFLGQQINLTPIKGVLTSLHDTASSMAKSFSTQHPLKFPIPKSNSESWLLTTYLDAELRISRDDGGSIYVLIKEGSPLLAP